MDKEDNKRFHTFGGENEDFIKRESMSSIKDDGFCLAHGHLSDDGQPGECQVKVKISKDKQDLIRLAVAQN